MHAAMVEWGFRRLLCEWCVYVRRDEAGTVLIAVHATFNPNGRFSDLGDVRFCLGIGIVRDPERRTISLSQTALIDRIIAQFHQSDADPVYAPTLENNNLPVGPPKPGNLPSIAHLCGSMLPKSWLKRTSIGPSIIKYVIQSETP
ncbi:hypothetical protein C8J57DRAFT_1509404 [Mycena rebaudengoi]|nr:hypothetical protein C8J57DRAFT_1509404 [Mycena rebaudengoi]